MNGFADQGLNEGDFDQSASGMMSTFDAFPKTKRTYQTNTHNGGLYTIILGVFCIWLTSTEFWRWMEGDTKVHYSVEKGVAHDLQLNLDIVIPMLCEHLEMNVQDASGDRVLAAEMLSKNPTRWEQWTAGMKRDRSGRKVRHDHVEAPFWVREEAVQYKAKMDVHNYLHMAKHKRHWATTPPIGRGHQPDACRIYGSFESNKVQGDFHITARGHGYQSFEEHVDHAKFNFTHHVNELSFGPYFPDIIQPLDNAQKLTDKNFFRYQYYLSIVPTIYTDAIHKLEADALHKKRKTRQQRKPVAQGTKNYLKGNVVQRLFMHNAGVNPYTGEMQETLSEPHPSRDRAGTRFASFLSRTIYTNQYAVTEQSHPISPEAVGEQSVPGIFLKYDFEPILLTVSEEWGGFLGLFVRCVNVVAGILVAGGWVVSLMDWVGEVIGRRRRRTGSSGGSLLYSFQSEKSSLG